MTEQPKTETLLMVNGRSSSNRQLRRIIRLAAGFPQVIEVQRADRLISDQTVSTVVCWAEDAAAVMSACAQLMPNARVLVWSPEPGLGVFELASENPRVQGIIAWPPEDNLPPSWLVGYAFQRLGANPRRLSPLSPLAFEGEQICWHPRTTQDLFATLEDLGRRLDEVEFDKRSARRIIGVGHELLMNAMYDAPHDNGKPRFAHDRTQSIELSVHEAPGFTLRTDGLTLTLQISDPFGCLRREHVFGSLVRGLRAESANHNGEVLDTSGGGAGLGLHRIICSADATVFDVVGSYATNVTTTFNLGQSNRERRRAPKSLLFFHRAAAR